MVELFAKDMEDMVAVRLNSVGDDDFPLPEQHRRQEIDKYPVEGTLSGALAARNQVNTVIEQVRERRRLDSCRLEQFVRLCNGRAEVQVVENLDERTLVVRHGSGRRKLASGWAGREKLGSHGSVAGTPILGDQ